jgi:hypothetical protein
MPTDAMDRLIEILKAEGRLIAEEFKLASEQGEGTPQEVADFREHAIQSFVGRFLPQSHIVSKGKITDLEGNQSDSIDCLILNPAHPNLVDSQGKFRLIFSDGCDAAIEVKPNLARTDELHRGLLQGQSVKRTKRSRSPLLLQATKPPHIVNHSQHIPFYMFAVRAFDPATLWREVTAFYAANAVPLEEQLDAIFVNGVGVVKNIKYVELNMYGSESPVGGNTGWYFEEWGDATLIGLLLSLEYSFPAVASISESIMKRVLTKLGRFVVHRLGDGV